VIGYVVSDGVSVPAHRRRVCETMSPSVADGGVISRGSSSRPFAGRAYRLVGIRFPCPPHLPQVAGIDDVTQTGCCHLVRDDGWARPIPYGAYGGRSPGDRVAPLRTLRCEPMSIDAHLSSSRPECAPARVPGSHRWRGPTQRDLSAPRPVCRGHGCGRAAPTGWTPGGVVVDSTCWQEEGESALDPRRGRSTCRGARRRARTSGSPWRRRSPAP